MTIPYAQGELLHQDPLTDLSNWHHEGTGEISPAANGGMQLHCFGSAQGREGCQAFFRADLPDCIAVEYDLTVLSQGGLVINFLAMRGLQGEDMIADADRLRPRAGVFGDYVSATADLQSYHVSVSRFGDDGVHTGTSNWRRNPGLILVGHGEDLVNTIGKTYRMRLVKDRISLQLFVDGCFAHGCIDRLAGEHGIPDTGKFGFRLIGSDVKAEVINFRAYAIEPNQEVTKAIERSGL